MKLVFSADDAALRKAFEEIRLEMQEAAEGAVKEAADLAVKEGQANVASAGFSSRAQQAVQSKFFPGPNPSALVFDSMPFASVFERGVTIGGHPLLWLPIEANLPAGVRSPGQYGHKLVSVNVGGKPPMLFDAANRLLGPVFVGIKQATIRKRFDLVRIFRAAAARMQEFYDKRMQG